MTHSNQKRIGTFGVAAILAMLAGTLYAAEKADNFQKRLDAERREAQDEAQREEKLTLAEQAKMRSQFNGILTIQSDLDNGNPEVIGALTCTDDQKVYLIKLDSKDLLKVLQRNDGKKITLGGRMRNSGKYLLVTGMIEHQAGPPRIARRSMGGI